METVVVTEKPESETPANQLLQQAQEYGEMKAEFRQLQNQLQETLSKLSQMESARSYDNQEVAALRQQIVMLQEQKSELKEEMEAIEESESIPDVTIVEAPPLPEPQTSQEAPQAKRSKLMDWLLG